MTEIKKTTLYLPLRLAEKVKAVAADNHRSFNSEVVISLKLHVQRENKRKKRELE